MSEARYTMAWYTGTVELGRPTGHFAKCADGLWREVYTDEIVRDDAGRIIERRPRMSAVGFRNLGS